jgi:S1-C subfamily serine protease
MKKIIQSFLALIILSLSSGVLADNNQIKLTVKGYHNDGERILDNNSILFTGDSFQLSVEALDTIHIYAYLLDSGNNLQLLNSPNLPSLVTQNQHINFPSNTDNWFQLDENVGVETLIILSASSKINASEITLEELIKLDNIKKFTIKHIGTKLAMRGISDLQLISGDNLETKVILPQMVLNNVGSALSDSNFSSQTIIQIMGDSKNSLSNTSKTRGVKEVRIFEDSAPAVVFIETVSPPGHGTGALISNDGLIFTNAHVVGDSKKVNIYFKPKNANKYSREDYHTGVVVNINKTVDLALIKLTRNPVGIKPLNLANPSSIKVGQDVHAIGHPGNFAQWTYTRGYIGQILNNHEWLIDGVNFKAKTIIQSQTPIMGGNSGGPLLNDDGLIIGVNTYVADYVAANYSVSVKDLKLFLDEKYTIPEAPTKTSATKSASKYWESNVIAIKEMDIDDDGINDTLYYVDDDNTGIWEVILIKTGSNDELVVILDWDEDGKWNEKIINTNSDSTPDFYIYDDDGDGVADYFGYDDNDDWEVDRYEEA